MVDKLKGKWINKVEERQYGFGDAIPLGYENVLFPFGILVLSILFVYIIAMAELGLKSYGM